MIKHLLTTACPRSCSYCISRNIKIEQAGYKELLKLPEIYDQLAKEHDEIMLTGGEPTSADHFDLYFYLAKGFFKQTFITTQNPHLLNWKRAPYYFDAITFSWHDLKYWDYEVKNGAMVYCSIMSHLYSDWLLQLLPKLGYAGLTINENHFGGEIFDEKKLPKLDNFSIRINRRGECFKKDVVYIMPDLSITTNFKEYL